MPKKGIRTHLTNYNADNVNDDSDNNSQGLNDLMSFCMQLVHHSQWKSERVFHCGSFMEIPYNSFITQEFGVGKEMLDMDLMMHFNHFYAGQQSVEFPENYHGQIIRLYTDQVHAGYARLIKEGDNTEVQIDEVRQHSSWTAARI